METKQINVSIPKWWPSGKDWKHLTRWLLPNPGTIILIMSSRSRAHFLPFDRRVSPPPSPNRTCTFQRIRLSITT